MGPKGMPGDERVSSESSGLFREIFEISRTIEEHEARLRTLNQAKERILADPGASPPELERLARVEAQLHEERIMGLNRLRERSDRLTEAIDKATQSLENAPGTDTPAPRVDILRMRLDDFRSALEKSGEDDEQFYNALREFAIGKERTIVQFQRGPGDQPPNERMMRLEREIEILQDRLRELDMELRQLREQPFPPPMPPMAPVGPGIPRQGKDRQSNREAPPPPAPRR
jgi:DNA repair exonuclease SbcCD ATPase subunit